MQMQNKFVEGIYSVSKVYERLNKSEYEEYVGSQLQLEQKELHTIKVELKEKFGTIDNATEDGEAFARYTRAYKAYKNKQDALRRKAMKVLSEKRRKEALDNNMVVEDVDEGEDEVEVIVEEDTPAEVEEEAVNTSNNETTRRAPTNDRGEKNDNRRSCRSCHTPIQRFYLTNLARKEKRLSVSGQHTATKKYLVKNAPVPLGESGVKCCICNKVFKNKDCKGSAREHMKKHDVKKDGVVDVDFDAAKQLVKQFFQNHFQINWDRDLPNNDGHQLYTC